MNIFYFCLLIWTAWINWVNWLNAEAEINWLINPDCSNIFYLYNLGLISMLYKSIFWIYTFSLNLVNCLNGEINWEKQDFFSTNQLFSCRNQSEHSTSGDIILLSFHSWSLYIYAFLFDCAIILCFVSTNQDKKT